jgi:hypothetical integral membrane protein (TIGR02206 family)
MNSGFQSFSLEHFSALFACGLVTYAVIRKGKASEMEMKTHIALVLSGLTFSTLLIEAIVKGSEGTYDYFNDLPLFLCDLVAILLPFVLYHNNRKWIGILYFWALAGTLQALITPDLKDGFPSFDFFRYFFTHAGIVAAVLYTVVVWKIKINWKDFFNAIVFAQVYLVSIHIINQLLGSNYAYTMHKPPGPTVLDLMGAWPWYILWGEFLMVILFLLLMVPFLVKKDLKEGDSLLQEL